LIHLLFPDPDSAAERAYRRQLKLLKPDMKAYSSQKSSAPSSSSGATSLIRSSHNGASGSAQVIRRDDLLSSDNSTLSYGEHKPDDAALDRVSSHLNAEAVLRTKHSRRRPDDSEAEVNYINDKNKHYNKKIARFYDKYTTEIRENCKYFCMANQAALTDLLCLAYPPFFLHSRARDSVSIKSDGVVAKQENPCTDALSFSSILQTLNCLLLLVSLYFISP
jgi:hypothetical protein